MAGPVSLPTLGGGSGRDITPNARNNASRLACELFIYFISNRLSRKGNIFAFVSFSSKIVFSPTASVINACIFHSTIIAVTLDNISFHARVLHDGPSENTDSFFYLTMSPKHGNQMPLEY